ncbi:DUF4232 domain-containing protein [Actinoplanes awajinensis]|uniref:DUF4232 domain-containing protein n=1 Tax=Actinoplanes awajinensis subsp. mycoplanecinus TaxID=135947 RepID=A0A0X3V8N6_9ACTN|nr:DUF4232 domain-containing protein [Actinoplanes awajinensis]KUL41209.1 hypothetical protein ADL15_05255 [Actinoplanes awajinensis subsp. mycoplanecinus]
MKRAAIVLLCTPLLFAAGCSASSQPSSAPAAPPAVSPTTSATGKATATTTATATATATGKASGKPVATPRCHTGDLKLKIGDGSGAAGTSYVALLFTNASDHTCTLYGYPGVSWVTGDQGTQVGSPFKRGGTQKKVTVTLKPGKAAHTIVQSSDAGFFDAAECTPTAVRGLRVYPPDETASVFVSSTGNQCAAEGVDVGTIWAITPGTKLDPS